MTTKVTHGVTSFNTGQLIQSVSASYTGNADLATIPHDDTIPQIGEGTEIMTVAFTPKYATSKIRVRASGQGSSGSTDNWIAFALFVDATANALCAATGGTVSTATGGIPVVLDHEESAGSVVARTYRIRAGGTVANTRMNGQSAGRFFGGVAKCVMIVEEIAA